MKLSFDYWKIHPRNRSSNLLWKGQWRRFEIRRNLTTVTVWRMTSALEPFKAGAAFHPDGSTEADRQVTRQTFVSQSFSLEDLDSILYSDRSISSGNLNKDLLIDSLLETHLHCSDPLIHRADSLSVQSDGWQLFMLMEGVWLPRWSWPLRADVEFLNRQPVREW